MINQLNTFVPFNFYANTSEEGNQFMSLIQSKSQKEFKGLDLFARDNIPASHNQYTNLYNKISSSPLDEWHSYFSIFGDKVMGIEK